MNQPLQDTRYDVRLGVSEKIMIDAVIKSVIMFLKGGSNFPEADLKMSLKIAFLFIAIIRVLAI